MHEKKIYLTIVLVFLLGLSNSVFAQNNPFGEDTAVSNPQSSDSPFAVGTSDNTAAEITEMEINGSMVNVRRGPGTNNAVLKTLPRGSKGRMLRERDGWFEIDFGNGLTGWVKGTLLNRVTSGGAQTPSQPANSRVATENARQIARWERHLGRDLLDFTRFPWYWRLNRAQKAFEKGNFREALELAQNSSGNPLEQAFMMAKCYDKLGENDKAERLLKLLEPRFEDIVFTRKLEAIAEPYINEPVVFKFGGFDDIDTYRKKKAAGNRIGLESSEYYEKYVDIRTWKWRSNQAYKDFEKIAGIDCSGFVQMLQKNAFADAGVKYPITSGRTSTSGLWSQKFTKEINPGVKPPPPPDIRPGDMILLDYGHNRYGHSMIYKGKDAQGNIIVMQMGATAETNILPAHKFEFYKGTYRMNGMDQVRKALTA